MVNSVRLPRAGTQYSQSETATMIDEIERALRQATVAQHVPQIVSSASATVQNDAGIVYVDYTATGAVTLSLYSAVFANYGGLIIKDRGNNAATYNITINAAGSETIDGSSSRVINSNRGVLHIVSDGANWNII